MKFATALVAMMLLCGSGFGLAQAAELSDYEISNAVDDALADSLAVSARDVDVVTSGGIVTLSGDVGSVLEKDRAEVLATTVKGVRGVVNQIEVQAPLRTDTAIEEDADSALLADAATESWEIETSVADGMVTLSGTADSWQEKQLAAKVVKGVRGVKGIDNKIDVVYDTERTDYEIEQEIDKALRWNAYVDDALIQVGVDEGSVELSGTVDTWYEREVAADNAWEGGAVAVDNNLTVAYGPSRYLP